MGTKYLKIGYIIGGALFLGIMLLYFFNDPASMDLFPKCPIYSTTGIYCTGCGSQRALNKLLHLDVMGAIGHNLLFVPAILVIMYNGIIKLLELKNKREYFNILYQPKTPIIILVIMIVFTILRNLNMFPFNFLAP